MSSTKATPLPRKKVLALCACLLVDTIAASSLYPYINFMVQSFNVAPDERKIGYYVGFLASSYYFAQFLCSFIWGWFSDRMGRKPSLLIGLLGSSFAVLMFGFSPSFYWAVGTRFLAGILNGNVGVAKSMMGEITDSTNQARAFSIVGIVWSIGGIVGPLIGGVLSSPSQKYPSIFKGSIGRFFELHPFLLPNMISSLMSICGFLLGVFVLEETKKIRKGICGFGKQDGFGSEISFQKLEDENSNKNENSSNVNNNNNSNNNSDISDEALEIDNWEEQMNFERETKQTFAEKLVSVFKPKKEKTYTMLEDMKKRENGVESLSNSQASDVKRMEKEEFMIQNQKPIWKDKNLLLVCALYSVLGFIWAMWDEVFPIFAFTDLKYKGLQFTSTDIGITGATAGVFSILFQTFCFTPIVKKWGLIKTYKVGSLIVIPTLVCFPEIVKVIKPDVASDKQPLLWVLVLGLYLCQQCSAELTFVSVIIMVSNTALPEHMGIVNGIAQSAVSLMRMIAPALSTSLFSWSLVSGVSVGYPMDQHLIFYFMTVLIFVIFGLSFFVDASINVQKSEALKRKVEQETTLQESNFSLE
eukprot:TRINITY_DN618_c0_g1_i1.p1 TRINITY_DN618_c0_g1~~TRINITY_DN618_c0_g1_i1.p1  ORF type:complete len:585 (+),score=111.21 TRINITY_DN618_c0_g1_i1:372-2126(+)